MDQESETPKPNLRPPDLKAPDLAPPPSIPAPSFTPPPAAPPVSPASFGPPPTMEIPEEAKKKVKEVVPDEDEVKAGDIAPFNTRVVAAVIDWGVVLCLTFVLSMVSSILGLLGNAAAIGYMLTKDSLPFLGGQSIGKKVMKLRAVTADGAPLTGNWEKGVLRNAFLLLAPVELIILLIREEKPEKGRRLGDDFAKTKVIVEAEPVQP
jgi:uncharacterized RDD family membrane protein YckC